MVAIYGGGNNSSIGVQLTEHYWWKKALIDLVKERYFGNQASTINMPKNMGKKIKRYHYLPLLDDANVNDQGIDANGAATDNDYVEASVAVGLDGGGIPDIPPYYGTAADFKVWFTGIGADGAAAEADATEKLRQWMVGTVAGGGLGLVAIDAAATILAMAPAGAAYVKGFRFYDNTGAEIATTAALDTTAVPHSGNLYGSSKDIGTIAGKMPTLTEVGGRVNRVGHKRIDLEGTLAKFGFFDEYTQESLDFDTDDQLLSHISREMLRGANEITEDALQIDLINGAGVVRFSGPATSLAGMSGVTETLTEVSYSDLSKLSISLDNNRCPKATKLISGSRMVDTRTVAATRLMYIGSEMQTTFEKMKDHFDNAAFIPVQNYAAAADIVNGEIGTVGHFKIIVVPEMMHHAGVGILEGVNAGYRVTNGKYDAYPLMVIGDESFTTIGFQTSGKSVKFKIYHKKPGEGMATREDPYGELGFMSIKWYYGFMLLRPERLAVTWSVAQW
jgi:N4-gp56 family major capsid protein